MTRTGRTSHHTGPMFTRELSTTWLWFGVGTNRGAVGGPVFPAAFSSTERSTEDACIVQVPGTALFGSGHWVGTAGCVFQASGMNPKRLIRALRRAGTHSSV